MDRVEPGHRFLGKYDKDRVLRCIRCGQLPMQHYPDDRESARNLQFAEIALGRLRAEQFVGAALAAQDGGEGDGG